MSPFEPQVLSFAKHNVSMQHIVTAAYQPVISTKPIKGFVTKWLWKALHKLGATEQYMQPYEVITIEPTHFKGFAEMCYGVVDQLMFDGCKLSDFAIVIGRKQFDDMMGDIGRSGSFSFYLEMNRNYKIPYPYKLHGMYVHVVPYVSGVAAIERTVFEREPE